MRRLLFYFLYVTVLCLFTCAIGEIGCRLLLRRALRTPTEPTDERSLAYRHDEELGWFPRAGTEKTLVANRTITAKHNSRGFRDHEHGKKEKPRIVFLGDSFVWGYDAQAEERFTEKLQARIPDWEVINLGVSGYGTDQEYLLLERIFDFYRPDIVFLIYTPDNDEDDNSSNVVYGGYFKPYFVIEGGEPKVRGIPVPKGANYYFAEHPILYKSYLARAVTKLFVFATQRPLTVPSPTKELLLAMRRFVENRGARFAVAWDRKSRKARFCRANRIPFLEMGDISRFPDYGYHWTPEGHTKVSEKLLEFLRENGWLEKAGVSR